MATEAQKEAARKYIQQYARMCRISYQQALRHGYCVDAGPHIAAGVQALREAVGLSNGANQTFQPDA